jgi:putative hydrolase of the HAD superfamily
MQNFVQRARGADASRVLRPEAVAAIDAAQRAGCRLAILSNELDLFYGAGFASRLPLLARFDAVVDATYTGILKPDPRAYALVCTKLGVAAADCVFVDDQPRNVLGALRAGMDAVQLDVTEPRGAFDDALRRLGVHS